MTDLLRKLQFKDQARIYVRKAPPEFRPTLAAMGAAAAVGTSPGCKRKDAFAIYFVTSCAEIAEAAPLAARKVEGDGVLWFAYPKKSSKRYATDLSRDHGWRPLGDLGFEGVRQVAIDEDWTALRFRRVEHIKSLRRAPQRALTTKGKSRGASKRSH